MQVIVSILLGILSFADATAYGGSGGQAHTFQCSGSNVIKAIAFQNGNYLDAIAFKCTNEDWGPWYGGTGGGYHHVYARASGFCGFWGRAGVFIDRICVQDAYDGSSACAGGHAGSAFTDRLCSHSPGNNRMRLKGFHIRSGGYVDRLEPIWDFMNCQNYLTVQQVPHGHSEWSGDYEFVGWTSGHHRYQKVGVADRCVYYAHQRWRFGFCSTIGHDTSVFFMADWDRYDYCVHNLGGNDYWHYYSSQSNGWTNIYPQLQITGRNSLPLSWGNTVGFWEFLQAGQGYGGSITHTIQRRSETNSGREYTTEEENSFSQTLGTSETHGAEVTVGAEFKGMSAEAKYNYAHEATESTTNAVRANIISAVSHATSSGTSTTRQCTTMTPNKPHNTWVWMVYRASSEHNNGATQQTCTFQHQTGACRHIPPNCPIGECRDANCIYCADGVTPLTPVANLRANFAACFEEIEGQDIRCHPEFQQWSCCTPSQPCLAGEGDCDNDADCEGDLICLRDPEGVSGDFDICGYSTRRRLLQTSNQMAEHSDPDNGVEEEKEHDQPHGCGQFDDEAHCETGPLYKFCEWNEVDKICSVKENVEEGEIPENDFTWVYEL